MHRYVGAVRLGSSTLATATIDDLDSSHWIASMREVVGFDHQNGLVTVYLLDGDRAGAFAVGDLEHRDSHAIVHGTTGFGLGGTDPGPHLDLPG